MNDILVIFLGDIHGNFNSVKNEIKRKRIGNNKSMTYIIQVGDFGIGFNDKSDLQTLEDLNNFFKRKNIIFLAIRGNHDNPHYFKGNHIYSNLKLLEDYTTMQIGEYNYLFVGGAVSIDRLPRISGDQIAASYGSSQRTYWKDEIFVYDEEKLKTISNIDIVVTHTSPEYCSPDNRNGFGYFVDEFAYHDKELYNDLTTERSNVTKMFEYLRKNSNIRYAVNGHFHKSNIDINGYTSHYLLNINEFLQIF